jgi:hypothetical protein
LELPHFFGASGLNNVLWSAGVTVAGAALLAFVPTIGKELLVGYATGGTVITAAKALHHFSNGNIGLDPATRFPIPGLNPNGNGTEGYYPVSAPSYNYTPALSEAPTMNELPGDYSTGIVRPVGAFRESEYDSSTSNTEEPLLA